MKNLLIPLLIFVCSCNHSNNQSEKDETFELTTFTEIPDILIGCGCAYSLNENDLNEGRFIYVDDLGELSMIKVNNATVMIDMTVKSRSPYFVEFQKDSIIETGYESEKLIGRLKIRKSGTLIFDKNIVGICGC